MNEGIDVWLEEGLRFYSQGDPSRALEAWYKILDVEPSHSLAQQYVAYVRQVYRLDAAPAAGKHNGEKPLTPAQASAGLQQTETLDKAMANPSVPATESLPPAPTTVDKKPAVGLDASSSWSDVVDSAFDVSPAAGKEAPKPAAKMAMSNPWAARVPPAAKLEAKAAEKAAEPAPPAEAPKVEEKPAPPPEMSSKPEAQVDIEITAEPTAELALTQALRIKTIEPEPEPPELEPISTSQPRTAPVDKAEMAALVEATVPAASPPEPPPEKPPEKPPVPAPAHARSPASDNAGFDPWRGDTMPPVVPTWTPTDAAVDIEMPPPTPAPITAQEIAAAVKAAEASIDVEIDLTEEAPAPSPAPTPAVEVDIDLAETPSFLSPPAAAATPAWKQSSVDEIGPGVRKVGGGGRVDVVGGRAPTPASTTGPARASAPVEERVAKPSRRFDNFDATPSKPMPPSPSPSPPPAAAAPPTRSPFAKKPPADSPPSPPEAPAPSMSSSASAGAAGSMSSASVSSASMSSGSMSPGSMSPGSMSSGSMSSGSMSPGSMSPGSMSSGSMSSGSMSSSFGAPGSATSPFGAPGSVAAQDTGPGMVVDPWDEIGGPGTALDLDKVAPAPSKFDALLGTGSGAKVEQWPSPEHAEPPEDQCTALMRGAKELFDLGDFSGSLDLVEKVLKIDPENAGARGYMKRNEATLVSMYESKLGDMRRTPRQLMPPDEVIWMNMHHRAGFILSQVDGSLTFEDILEISGMPRFDAMRILADLVQQGIIG